MAMPPVMPRDRGVAIVHELENIVDRFVGIAAVDGGEYGVDALLDRE